MGNQRTLGYNFMEILRIKEHAVLFLSKKPQRIGGCLQNDQQCLLRYLSGS